MRVELDHPCFTKSSLLGSVSHNRHHRTWQETLEHWTLWYRSSFRDSIHHLGEEFKMRSPPELFLTRPRIRMNNHISYAVQVFSKLIVWKWLMHWRSEKMRRDVCLMECIKLEARTRSNCIVGYPFSSVTLLACCSLVTCRCGRVTADYVKRCITLQRKVYDVILLIWPLLPHNCVIHHYQWPCSVTLLLRSHVSTSSNA